MIKRTASQARDCGMIVLYHQFGFCIQTGVEKLLNQPLWSLIEYGDSDGESAMAKTVSLPAAIAVKLLLKNKVNLTGFQTPLLKELYNPVRNELSENGIRFRDLTKMFA